MIALPTSTFDALYDARAEHLLLFFGRRWPDAQAAVDGWAETWAQACLARRRLRGLTEAEAVSWLYALAYRRLAAAEHSGCLRRDALSRLGLRPPAIGEADAGRLERLIADPARLGEFDSELDAPAASASLDVVHHLGAGLRRVAEERRRRPFARPAAATGG